MLILKGILIGVSTVVPGLSGGTLAVILKLYDRLISSVRFFSFSKKDKYKHLFFLGQVFLGCLIGVVAFSHLMEYLLRARSIQTHFFFLRSCFRKFSFFSKFV